MMTKRKSLRGRFKDSSGGTVERPSSYQKAYTNGLGDYRLTNDPNFNPSELPGTWREVPKQP